MSPRRFLVGACALSAALAVMVAPAQARILNVTEDVPSTTNNCETGEEIVYTQTYHIVARTEIVDGEEVLVEVLNLDLREAQGVGVESGDRYLIRTSSIQRDASNPLTLNGQFQVINPGPGADFLASEVHHTTFNANGELTVFHTSGNIRCGDFHDHVNVKL